jgi:adenylate kinase
MIRTTLLGPPGAGKGTQAAKISEHFNLPHISTGQILRNNKDMETEHGTPGEYMDRGDLVPDQVMIAILEQRLQEDDCKQGYILDGFPRTEPQAERLDEIADLDLVIYLNVTEENVIERITGRRICERCDTSYHIDYDPPPTEDTCSCGGPLHQREDDTEKTVKHRLETYRETTKPLIAYYREQGRLHEIDGNPGIDEVWQTIRSVLQEYTDEPARAHDPP